MLFIIFFSVTFTLITLILGLNMYAAFGSFFPGKLTFWIFIIVLTQFYLIVRFLARSLRFNIPDGLYFAASSIFAVVLLALTMSVIIDIVYAFSKYIPVLSPIYKYISFNTAKVGVAGIIAVFAAFGAGLYFAGSVRFNFYTIPTLKLENGEKIRIVQISDVHVTSFTSVKRLESTVKSINELNPDIVVITGDLLDDDLQPYKDKNINGILSKLTPKYGVFFVMGNHEYYGGDFEETARHLDEAMTVLRDEFVYIPALNLSIAGRNDLTENLFVSKRKNLKDIIPEDKKSSYIIVLDHQPHKKNVDEADASGADLMISGHTHYGQMFPINFVVDLIYPKAWGLLKKDAFNLIVSCGYGTWGPPLRLGSYAEVVVIDIEGAGE